MKIYELRTSFGERPLIYRKPFTNPEAARKHYDHLKDVHKEGVNPGKIAELEADETGAFNLVNVVFI